MPINITRRRLIGQAGLLSLAGAGGFMRPSRALAGLPLTPRQSEGPFYPQYLPLDRDNDLTIVEGQTGTASGTLTDITGQVTDADGRPQPSALVEIWQTNAFGRYHHPDDRSPSPLDPNFQGYGQTTTDDQGRYRFRTIRPMPYLGRTPHIHFAIKPSNDKRLITQMYLEGEPGNDRDRILGAVRDPAQRARILVPLTPANGDTLQGIFDIVLGA